jgi:hypothetical protein
MEGCIAAACQRSRRVRVLDDWLRCRTLHDSQLVEDASKGQMNFTDKQKAWITLVCIVAGTGIAFGVTAYEGGAKPWIAVLLGVSTAATNVLHALSSGPNKTTDSKS